MVIYCNKCGAKNKEDSDFCKECGAKLDKKTTTNNGNKKKYIIAALIVILCAILVVSAYFILAPNDTMKTMDFGAFTMSVPTDANLVSNSTYDSLGSSWGWNDNPNGHYSVYYDDLTTLVGSATAAGSQIKVTSGVEQLTSDQLNVTGNCTIYRHVKDGKDEYWAYYETGNYAITLKADSMNHLIKMLNSIQMK